jgi:hypothetical protein
MTAFHGVLLQVLLGPFKEMTRMGGGLFRPKDKKVSLGENAARPFG